MEVVRLTVKMGEKKVEMSMKEAERLYDMLHKMFGTTEVIVKHEHHYDWYINQPFVTSPQWDAGTIMCDNTLSAQSTGHVTLDVGGVL